MKGTEVGAVKILPKISVYSVDYKVEVESEMSIIGSTFHKRGTLLKKKCIMMVQ